MEQNDKIGHRPSRVHHFPFGGGEGVGGIRKILGHILYIFEAQVM